MPFSRQVTKNGLIYALIGLFVVGGVVLGMGGNANASVIASQYDFSGGFKENANGSGGGIGQNIIQPIGNGYSSSVGSISAYVRNTGGGSGTDSGSTVVLAAYTDSGLTSPSFSDWCSGTHTPLLPTGFEGWVTDPITGCTMNPALYYAILVPSYFSTGTTFDVFGGSGSFAQSTYNTTAVGGGTNTPFLNMAFELDTSTFTPPNTSTHFTGESISTTTRTITVTGYIAAEDVTRPVNYSLTVSTPIYPVWNQDSFIATTSGNFNHSFQYTGSFASTTIEQFTFSGQLFYYVGNPFNSASSTQILDTFSTTTFPGIADASFTPAELDVAISENCQPFSSFWSVGLCIQYLVYPNPDQVNQNLTDIKNTFLSKAPMGYITRLVEIISASSTQSLPVLSYTWANDGGPLAGDTLTFDTANYFAQAAVLNSEMTSNTDHKTAWEIFSPLINIFLAIVLIFGMIHDISGLPLIHHRK